MSNKKKKLTKRDLDIMEILWKHEEPIAASEIQKEIPELSKNSLLLILKRLLDKEYVYVANISQNKKALMREFSPSVTKEQYLSLFMDTKTFIQLSASFIKQCDDMEVIDRLQKEIDKKKQNR